MYLLRRLLQHYLHPKSQPVESQLSSNRQEENDSGIVGIGREDDEAEERSTYSYEYIPLSINDWTVPVDAVYVSILPTIYLCGH